MKTPFLFILLLLGVSLHGQTRLQSLEKLLDSTRKVRDDSARIELNTLFNSRLSEFMQEPNFTIDSIRTLPVGQATSDDGQLVIINWNIQQNDGLNLYSAIIYSASTRKSIFLPIKHSEQKLDGDSIYLNNDWPAALYYKIISPKGNTGKYYILLGWDRFSKMTSRKTIEALSFNDKGEVTFGMPVFKTKEGMKHRVVIEYAAPANLTLNYSKQKLTLSGVRRSERKVNDSIIVVDRLEPMSEALTGQRWAYVPAGNIYDGYVYFKGYWTFVEGINARNPEVKNEDKKKPSKPEMGLFPH